MYCRSPTQDLDFTNGYGNQIEAGLQTDRKLMQCAPSWTLIDGFKPENSIITSPTETEIVEAIRCDVLR